MTTAVVLPALARSAAAAAAAAVVAPGPERHYADALDRRGWRSVAVDLAPRRRPLASATARRSTGYTAAVEHTGSLSRTVKQLRALKVSAVIAASPSGIELAEHLARQLTLPGPDPVLSLVRRDRGAQAQALTEAGIAAPRCVRTTSLTRALEWAKFCRLQRYVLSPALTGVPVSPAVCANDLAISAAWPEMRRAAARHGGDAHLVLSEDLTGRQYVVNSITRPGADGAVDHVVTDIWSETHSAGGLLDRSDLLQGQSLMRRSLTLYVRRVLDVLGVVHGPVSSRIVYTRGRGPVLLCAQPLPVVSLADEALRAATGFDRIGDAVDAVIAPERTVLRPEPTGHRVVRVALHPRGAEGIDAWLLRIVRQLPTVTAVSDGLGPLSSAGPGAAHIPEVVLSAGRPRSVDADYRLIRALERVGLHRAWRS